MLRGCVRSVLLLTAIMGLYSAAGFAGAQGLIPLAQRRSAAQFSLQDTEGNTYQLRAYRGKVLLLDFWATTCGGCKIEIPWYEEFEREFHDQGLTALGVATDDDWKVVLPYLASHPISYPVVLGSAGLETRYRVETLPMTLLIDRQGRVAAVHVGMADRKAFEREVTTLLRQ